MDAPRLEEKYYRIQQLRAHASCHEYGEVVTKRLGTVSVWAAGGAGQGGAAVGATRDWGSGKPSGEAAVVEVMVATGMHPTLAVLSFLMAARALMHGGGD